MRNSKNSEDDYRKQDDYDYDYDDEPKAVKKGRGRKKDDYYDDDYDDYEDDYDDRRKSRKKSRRDDDYDDYDDDYDDRRKSRKKSRRDDYDDDYDDYDDDGYDEGGRPGGNKRIIITTVVIVAVCIICILMIVFLGLKKDKDGEAQAQPETVVEQLESRVDEDGQTTAESASEEITPASITEDQAREIIINNLVNGNIMNADFTTNDGGNFEIICEGIVIIDGVAYYSVETSFHPADAPDNPTVTYYGVNCQDGSWTLLSKTNTGYSVLG